MSEGVNPFEAPKVEWRGAGPAAESVGNFIDAGLGRRFANRFVDEFVICVLFATFCQAIGVATTSAWLLVVGYYVFYVVYYASFEAFLGRTPGKLLTRTHVITLIGEKPGRSRLLGRTLARLVPFEPFSFLFGNEGWHDRWSGTRVVLERRRQFGDFR